MAALDLERLTVLLVEDSPFMKSLLTNSLKALGVGTIRTFDHGGEAIDLLRLFDADPTLTDINSLDLIISNWEMSPVDGMMFLRWIRRHKDSPDRFVPFIMITAHSEHQRLIDAREMGVTEVMAKPYTVNALAEKLMAVVERPRQFVHTKTYFGPDRRRQSVFSDREERRLLTDKSPGVEIVYG